jgi:putative ABC transport system permease protein
MQQWLNTFAYRIGLSPEFFVNSAVISLAIASLTILYNSLKAANTNPGDTLRYE